MRLKNDLTHLQAQYFKSLPLEFPGSWSFLIVIILGQSAQHKYIVLGTFINFKVHVCQF